MGDEKDKEKEGDLVYRRARKTRTPWGIAWAVLVTGWCVAVGAGVAFLKPPFGEFWWVWLLIVVCCPVFVYEAVTGWWRIFRRQDAEAEVTISAGGNGEAGVEVESAHDEAGEQGDG